MTAKNHSDGKRRYVKWECAMCKQLYEGAYGNRVPLTCDSCVLAYRRKYYSDYYRQRSATDPAYVERRREQSRQYTKKMHNELMAARKYMANRERDARSRLKRIIDETDELMNIK